MKSTIGPPRSPRPITFPCLMKYFKDHDANLIVLMTGVTKDETGIGTCMTNSNIGNVIGDYSNVWAYRYFAPYDGSVTLSND
jgi:hypothetical protein